MRIMPLFELRVLHAYYTGGRSSEFELVPSDDALALARGHRLVIKRRAGGVLVLIAVDAARAPEVPLVSGATMRFALRPQHPRFPLFTDVAAYDGMTAPWYGNAGLVAGQGGALSLGDDPSRTLDRGALAGVELTQLDAIDPAGGPAIFEITLAATAARWAYYVVTDVDPGAFTLVDNEPAGGAAPLELDADNNPRDLVSNPDPADFVAVELAGRYPQLRRMRFVSAGPIPAREEPRKYLELHVDGLRQAGALPNPSLGDYATLELTGGVSPPEPSLFRLIKHVTQTSSTT